jgi:hypothetical protein
LGFFLLGKDQQDERTTQMHTAKDTANRAATAARITLTQVEQSIARCLNAHPIVDYTLPRESKQLTELLALMIFHRVDAVDSTQLDEVTAAALGQWGVPQ